jgi:hypothetical protein
MDDPIHLPEPEAPEGAGISTKLWETICAHRKDVLAALQKIPSLLSAADKLVSSGNRYRAIVSKGNLHLLRERADGITKPWLRDARGHFVENVDRVRIPPDIAGAFATIAIQAALSQLSVKLDEVVRGVGDLAKLVSKANQGGVQGAIDAVEVARSLRDDKERRTLMLVACGNLLTELGTLAGQMDAHIAQMPPVETGFWDAWDGDGLTQAGAAQTAVRQDFAVIADGLRLVVSAYFELGEFEAARDAFSRICARVVKAGIPTAADRSRLLPYPKGGPGPEHVFEAFLQAIPIAEGRLRLLAEGEIPELEFEFNGEQVFK